MIAHLLLTAVGSTADHPTNVGSTVLTHSADSGNGDPVTELPASYRRRPAASRSA